MSKSALQALARKNGGTIPVVFDAFSGPLPSTAVEFEGLWVSENGELFVADDAVASAASYNNGLAFDENGRLLGCLNGEVNHYHQGLAFSIDGGLLATDNPIEYVNQGLPFNASKVAVSFSGGGGPPTIDWYYSGTQLLEGVGGVDSLFTSRASTQNYIDPSNDLIAASTDVVPTSFEGLPVLPEDTTRHWKANDGTGGKTGGPGGKGTALINITANYVSTGAPSSPQTGFTEYRQTAVTNSHFALFSDVDADAQNNSRPMLSMLFRVVGSVPHIRLGFLRRGTTNELPYVDFNPITGTVLSSSGVEGFQFRTLSNGWLYAAVYGNSSGGIFNITTGVMYFLDNSGNKSFPGDTNNGLDVFATSYSDVQFGSLYNPVLSPVTGNVSRFEPTAVYGETSAAATTSSNYTLFFEFEVRQDFDAVDGTLLALYANASLDGWAFVFVPTATELRAFRLAAGVPQAFAGVDLGATPVEGDTLDIMLEIKSADPFTLTVGANSADAPATPSTFPTNLTRFWQYFNDPTTVPAFGIYKNMKRLQGVDIPLSVAKVVTP